MLTLFSQVMNHANLCASMYKRAAEELGGRERWVEALPFAVIDYNQTPVKCFGGLRISPFEVIFFSFLFTNLQRKRKKR